MLYADFRERIYDGRKSPQGELERCFYNSKLSCAGIDEVGRGCLAGPVYAACVVLDYEKLFGASSEDLKLFRDSKTLSHKQRIEAIEQLKSYVVAEGVGAADAREIEVLGILQASFLAMRRAISKMSKNVDLLMVDGNQRIPGIDSPQIAVIKGDKSCYAVAAASILAKEARDDFMRSQHEVFPEYGFCDHVGYGTKYHLEALSKHGPSPLHRMNFAPLKKSPIQLSFEFSAN